MSLCLILPRFTPCPTARHWPLQNHEAKRPFCLPDLLTHRQTPTHAPRHMRTRASSRGVARDRGRFPAFLRRPPAGHPAGHGAGLKRCRPGSTPSGSGRSGRPPVESRYEDSHTLALCFPCLFFLSYRSLYRTVLISFFLLLLPPSLSLLPFIDSILSSPPTRTARGTALTPRTFLSPPPLFFLSLLFPSPTSLVFSLPSSPSHAFSFLDLVHTARSTAVHTVKVPPAPPLACRGSTLIPKFFVHPPIRWP